MPPPQTNLQLNAASVTANRRGPCLVSDESTPATAARTALSEQEA